MNKNTTIRLHIPKALYESLAKQVLAEGKKGDMSGGAYTEAVKQPKAPKSMNSDPKKHSKDEKGKGAKSLDELKALHEKLGKRIQEMEQGGDKDDR
jgi:hypothetical protein